MTCIGPGMKRSAVARLCEGGCVRPLRRACRENWREGLHDTKRGAVFVKHRTARPHHAARGCHTRGLLPLTRQSIAQRAGVTQAFDAQGAAADTRLLEQKVGQRPAPQTQQGTPRASQADLRRHAPRPNQRLAVDAQDHLAHPHAPVGARSEVCQLAALRPRGPLSQGLHFEAIAECRQPAAQGARRTQPLAQHRSARGNRCGLQVRPNSSPSSRARCCAAFSAFTNAALT